LLTAFIQFISRLHSCLRVAAGDSSALLRDTDDAAGDSSFSSASATLAANRARSAAAPALAQQPVNVGKVNLAEVRLQLQRQLKQHVSTLQHGLATCVAALSSRTFVGEFPFMIELQQNITT
jgi:hypothetical protein